MSRQLTIMKVNEDIQSVRDLKPGMIEPLGSSMEVVIAIKDVFPNADFTDPQWIVVDEGSYSIIFSIPEGEIVEFAAAHIYGDNPISGIMKLAARTGWKFVDSAGPDFVDLVISR